MRTRLISGITAIHSKERGRRPLPPWLLAAFKAIATKYNQLNAAGLPLLYSKHRTFCYPRPSPSTYFLLHEPLSHEDIQRTIFRMGSEIIGEW